MQWTETHRPTRKRRQSVQKEERDIRCHCGKLVARWEAHGLSIKCVRCQRLVSISYEKMDDLSS